jgi:hypothetical protein
VLGPVRDSVARYAIPSAARQLTVVPGTLGGRAEVLGALALVLSEMGDGTLLDAPRPVSAAATNGSVGRRTPMGAVAASA